MFKVAFKQEVKVPAHVDYLGELRNFVTKTGRKQNFPDSVVNAFKLCIDEAATNIIKHAYRDWDGMITMRIIVKKNSMTVTLIDQGKFFDPSRVDDPDLKRYVDIGKKGGLGIFIMRKLLDEIEYHHTEEGNELRLTKYKDSTFRKKNKAGAPSLSLSLKAKYSTITAFILIAAISIGYSFRYIKHGNSVLESFIRNEQPVCEDVARIISSEGFETISPPVLMQIVEDFCKDRKEIYRIIVKDVDDFVVYSTDEKLFMTEFKLPEPNKSLYPGLFEYKTDQDLSIYSFVSDIHGSENETEKVGLVFWEVKKELVSKQISSRRFNDLKVSLLILLIAYFATMILIYIIMNPFKKLSTWVKDIGHGNVKDEIDFDAGDEVGEIAKAFSDITDKFRKSQKNLAEQERIQKEMQLAQDIQQTLLPSETPDIEGYQVASFYESAKEVGGDYFDFINVDTDTLGIVVADVSGKGVPGSLIMTMIRTALRTEARSIKSASEVLARVNEFVCNDMKKGMFVTLYYIIIDSKKRRINYASAGHNPMILYRQSTNKTYYLNPRGFPVGISLPDPELFKKSIESDTIQLAEDDILLLYTDGITEAMNSRREMFGEERLQEVFRKYGKYNAEDFVTKLKDDIYSFTEGFEQNDDITVVAIKEQSTPEKIELNRAQNAHQMILKGKNIREACEEANITTYAYYNKYKKVFEEEGIDAYSIDDSIAVEAKHLSIEEKTRIYDIIKLHPEYGAKRISEELNTERYSFTLINESRIYDELVRSRLNTRQLREAYIARSGKKKRMKAPGTPMMTLDGKIILNRDYEEAPPPPKAKEKTEETKQPDRIEIPEVEPEEPKQTEIQLPKDPDDDFYLESLMTIPIEDLLKKQHDDSNGNNDSIDAELNTDLGDDSEDIAFLDHNDDESFIDEIQVGSGFDDEDIESVSNENHDQYAEASGDIEEMGIDDDLSFRDIWDEESEDETGENAVESDGRHNENNELEQDELPEETFGLGDREAVSEDELEFSSDDNSIIENNASSSLGIDDILSESDETEDTDHELSDDFSYEMLTDESSFKDEIISEDNNNGNNGKTDLLNDSNEYAPSQHETNEEVDDNFDRTDIESNISINESYNKFSEKTDFLDEEISDHDFSFNDLLEEIENDISYYDKEDFLNSEEEMVLESQPLSGLSEYGSENYNDSNAFISQQDRLREKHLLLGLKLYQENNFIQAIEQFNKVIEIYPDFKEAFSILGNAYYRNNQADLAISTYCRVKELDQDDADAYENTGVIYANMGKYEEAIREWEKVVKLRPDRDDVLDHINKAKDMLHRNDKITVEN